MLTCATLCYDVPYHFPVLSFAMRLSPVMQGRDRCELLEEVVGAFQDVCQAVQFCKPWHTLVCSICPCHALLSPSIGPPALLQVPRKTGLKETIQRLEVTADKYRAAGNAAEAPSPMELWLALAETASLVEPPDSHMSLTLCT